MPGAPGGAGAEFPPTPSWKLAFADEMLAQGLAAKRRDEEPFWSVRERLAARLGRLHTMRAVRRAAQKAKCPKEVELPSSDEEVVLPKKRGSHERGRRRQSEDADDRDRDRDRERDRDRKRKRRRSSSSSSSSSARPFRGAPSRAAGSRAQRDAQDQPHMVLVETLEEVTRSLPRTCEGANMNRSDLYKVLPAVFTTWFTLKLEPQLRAQPGGMRGLRECRTLAEVADDILTGAALPSLMKILGRIKAITEVSSEELGRWPNITSSWRRTTWACSRAATATTRPCRRRSQRGCRGTCAGPACGLPRRDRTAGPGEGPLYLARA